MTVNPTRRLGTIALVAGLVAAALFLRWLRSEPGDVYEIVGTTMGTAYSVVVDADLSVANQERVRAVVQGRLDELDGMMSTYDATSELSRFNRHGVTDPVEVSVELIDVLEMAREVGERSGGALDVTVGPLVEAWGFGPGSRIDGAPVPAPAEAELERLRESTGYERIVVDRAWGTVAKTHPETRVDLSAIAKGYAAESVAGALRALGLERSLVEVGGVLAATGTRRSGEPWRVGVESPSGMQPGTWGALSLEDEGIATSGDYRDYYERDGVRYAHIIDPRTGRPIASRGASVTVVHESAAMADAWATALIVLGPVEGYEVARREGIAALFIDTADGEPRSRATPALGDRIEARPAG